MINPEVTRHDPAMVQARQVAKVTRRPALLHSMVPFVLLLCSGLALYLPAIHTPLIPYLRYIYDLHILLGIIFAITLLTPLLRLIPKGKTVWRLDWWFPLVFGSAIVITGIVLWRISWFPTTWRSAAFKWHGDLTYLLGIWLIIHAFVKALGYRPYSDGWAGRVDPERRRFVKYLGEGVVFAAIVTVFDPFAAFSTGRANAIGPGGAITGSPGFAALYTVTGGYPTMSLADYHLSVGGQVSHPITLDWHGIMAIPRRTKTVDFQCVTGWSVANVGWAGIHISDLVRAVKPSVDATYVNFYSFDGAYTESLRLSEALDPTVLLAYQLDGKPLPPTQGAPLRLVVPKMYGYKSIKWVNQVEFSNKPLNGYWEQRGYPTEAFIGESGL